MSSANAKTIGGLLGNAAVVSTPAEVAAAAAADTAKLFASKLNQVCMHICIRSICDLCILRFNNFSSLIFF